MIRPFRPDRAGPGHRGWPLRALVPDRKARQREIERCLAEHGLLTRPRGVDARGGPADETGFARWLGSALTRLGPVYAAFGRYLASRPDLLRLSDCLELSALANRAEPAPAPAVLELVAAELPGAAADLFAEFAPEPVESGLLFQAHRARLRSGEEVVVRVVRPGVEASLALDLELLPLLAGLSDGRRGGLPFAAAVEDFRTALPQRLDLTAQADGLEALAADLERSPLVRVPRVLRELSGPRVIVLEWLAGTAIDNDPPPDKAPAVTATQHLAIAWLHQALLGRVLPVELRGAETLLPVGDGVIFTGGQFARPAASQQANLLGYLTAAADRDPDEAATHLLREMVATGPAGEEEIRLLLRQVVPFRNSA